MACSTGIGIIVWIYLLNIKVRGQVAGPNAVALVNGQTMLDCISNNLAASNWQTTPDGVSNTVLIATGCIVSGNNAAYYRTEKPGVNICRLIIANVTMQQAGVYTCYNGSTTVYQSLVTVIDPVASVVVYNESGVVVNDQLNISCSINYTGPAPPARSLRPLPYWTTSPGQIFTNATYHPSTNAVTLMATVTVQKYTVPIFQCNTVFEVTGSTIGYNATAPADSFTVGNTTEQHVQYYPENISIQSTTKDSCVYKPENLTCKADANPPAQYNWVDLSNNSTSTGAVKFINSSGQYQCTAYNVIRNQTYNETKTATEVDCSAVTMDNTSISGSHCENNSCTCENQSSVMLTCQAYGYPEPTVLWWSVHDFDDLRNGSIVVTIDGTYNCISSNEFGGKIYNATVSIDVSNCPSPCLGWIAVPVYEGLCSIVGVIFAIYMYYCNTEKRIIYNKHFPFLVNMLPCKNNIAHATHFECSGWIFLYILMVITVGLFMIPIMVFIVEISCCRRCHSRCISRTAVESGDKGNVDLKGTDHSENETPLNETKADSKSSKEIEKNKEVKETSTF